MSYSLSGTGVRGLLLDVEGTTTPIEFVYDVLFPFVRARVSDFLKRRAASAEVRSDLELLRSEHEHDAAVGLDPPPWTPIEGATSYVHWLMDQDRKSPGLKSLQGKIWQQGYLDGTLKGRVFPDVPPAMKEWHARSLDVRIYSSGSVLAQKLLFSRCEEGDLTRYLRGHFDTATGPKNADESYRRIATEMGVPPSTILFVSDVVDELDAARFAGMRTLLCVRPGNRPQEPGDHPVVTTFDQIAP